MELTEDEYEMIVNLIRHQYSHRKWYPEMDSILNKLEKLGYGGIQKMMDTVTEGVPEEKPADVIPNCFNCHNVNTMAHKMPCKSCEDRDLWRG